MTRRLALVLALCLGATTCSSNGLDAARPGSTTTEGSGPADRSKPTTTTTTTTTVETPPGGPTPTTVPDTEADPAAGGSLGGWSTPSLRWRPCRNQQGFQCATLTVPIDWSNVDGDTLDLAVARKRATGDRIGSLVTNPGGPGGSGLEYVFNDPFDAALESRFDIASWDPRGVGASTAFECEDNVAEFLTNDPDPDSPAEQAAIDDDARTVAADCARSNPQLVGFVGTDSVAHDLEALRRSLGDDELTYFGFSYGTLVGLRYLALFPTAVRAMVLDGVVDPTADLVDWLTGQTIAIDASLSRAFAACTKRTKCPVDDLAATYDRVKETVEKRPIRAGDRTLGPAELATGAIYVSYEPSLWKELGRALAEAAEGDGSRMVDLAQGYYDFGGFSSYVAVECLDSIHPVGSADYRTFADSLRALSPRIGGSTANELLPCAYWPTPPDPITSPVEAEGSSPILVMGNRGDAATPYEDSVKVADTLENGHLVSYDGEGHTSYGRSVCVNTTVNKYLVKLIVPTSDPDCGA